jgi:hypothetical protein
MPVDIFSIVFLVVPAALAAGVVFFGKTTWLPWAFLLLAVGMSLAAFL